MMHSVFYVELEELINEFGMPFSKEIMKKIEESKLLNARDASVKHSKIGGYQIIICKSKGTRIENRLCHKEQEDNASEVAEVIALLKLLVVLQKQSRHVEPGKITIGYNYRKSYDKI